MARLAPFCVALAGLTVAALAQTPTEKQRVLNTKRPQYPLEARVRHWSGSGVFLLHIRSNGTVERVETLKSIGYPVLDRAAITAFRQWRFDPPRFRIWRVPIRYVDGPDRIDEAMLRLPPPGSTPLITIFSGAK